MPEARSRFTRGDWIAIVSIAVVVVGSVLGSAVHVGGKLTQIEVNTGNIKDNDDHVKSVDRRLARIEGHLGVEVRE